MNDLIKIGKIIRQIRKSSEYKTQERFAELIDCSVETVSNIERGLVLISTSTLAKVSEACGISANYILGVGDNSDKKEP